MSWRPRSGLAFQFTMLPEGERDAGFAVCTQLGRLGSYVERFDAALTLSHQCMIWRRESAPNERRSKKYWMTSTWSSIAQRDAGMTIFDFKKAMIAIKAECLKSKSMMAHVSMNDLESPVKRFAAYFPDAETIRHALAHPSEVAATPKRNSFSGSATLPGGISFENVDQLSISGGQGNDTVFLTIENEIQQFDFNADTGKKLEELYEMMCGAFDGLAKFAHQAFEATLQVCKEVGEDP
jgi:hypothetical protein